MFKTSHAEGMQPLPNLSLRQMLEKIEEVMTTSEEVNVRADARSQKLRLIITRHVKDTPWLKDTGSR